MTDYHRMNEDGLETQGSQAKEQTVDAQKEQSAQNSLSETKTMLTKSNKNVFTEKEKEIHNFFQNYKDLENPQIKLEDHPEFLLTCISYNNGILYYDQKKRSIIQYSSLKVNTVLKIPENNKDQSKNVIEQSFDDIIEKHKKKLKVQEENQDKQEEGGEEEAENEAEEGENEAEEGENGEDGAEEGVNGEDGAEEGVNGEDGAEEGVNGEDGAEEGVNGEDGAEEGVNGEDGAEEEENGEENAEKETVTCLASFPELYLVALGSNHGNIYLLNSYDLEYNKSYKTDQDKVIDLVAGKNDIFSLHEDGSIIKAKLSEVEIEDIKEIEQDENEEALAIKISPNKRWLAFCQKKLKKNEKKNEESKTEDEYQYQLVVIDQGEIKKNQDDNDYSESYDESYSQENSDENEDSYGEQNDDFDAEDKKKKEQIRVDMKLVKEDLEEILEPFKKIKDYGGVQDIPSFQKIRNLFQFYPDSTKIVFRTELKTVTCYSLGEKAQKETEADKICEEKSRVVKMQVLFDNQTLVVMSQGEDQLEDIKIVDLEASSKKIRLGCSDAKEFCPSIDGKMIFVIDYDQKDSKSVIKGFDTKTRTLLLSLEINYFTILMNISNDGNFIHTYDRHENEHAFLQLADYEFILLEKPIMDDAGHFLMQYNKKTSQCELWDLKTEKLLGLYGKATPQTVCGQYFYFVEDLSNSNFIISRVKPNTQKEVIIESLYEDHYDLQVTNDFQTIYCLTDYYLMKYYFGSDQIEGENEKKWHAKAIYLWKSSYPQDYRCFQLSNDETFIIAVVDDRLFRIETQAFELLSTKFSNCPWWPKRLDAFHPKDHLMLSRYFYDQSVDKWDLKTNKSRGDYIEGHTKDKVEYCCFVGNGEKFITINPKELIYWDFKEEKHSMLEVIQTTALPVYGHNKKLTGLQIDGRLHPWTESLIWELSGNFAKIGNLKKLKEKNSFTNTIYKVVLQEKECIQGPFNKLFPFIFQQFDSYNEDDDDPDQLSMVQHMLTNTIAPQGFTFLSYLAYNNKQAFMKEALKYKPKYLRDINGNFPLTLALKKKSVTTVNQLVEFVAKDQKLVESLNHDEICRLLEFSPSNLPKLMNNSISKIRGANPLGIDINEDLTDFYTTNNVVPAELDKMLCDPKAEPEDKKPVIYKRTSYLLNLIPGSKESVKFHEALSTCKDPEVYQSDVIKQILEYKWQKLKSKTYLPLTISILFLLALLVHVYTPGILFPLYLLVIFLVLTVIQELRKLISGGIEYINYPSAILIILLPIYISETMRAPGSFADYILPVVNFAVWLNLVNQLKSFTNIRGFMIVLMESVISIKSFLAFFALMILMFTTSLIIQGKIRKRWTHFEGNKQLYNLPYSYDLYKDLESEKRSILKIADEIWQSIYDVYLKMLGEFGLENVFDLDDQKYNYFDQISFIILTFIMCVTLLNLVVALMSSAYEEYKELAVYQQQKELNSVILSVEITMSSQRNKDKHEYLIWMEYLEDNQEKKSELGQMNEKIDESQAKLNKILVQTKSQDDRIDKVVSSLSIVQKEQTQMNQKLEELINLIKVEKTQPPTEE